MTVKAVGVLGGSGVNSLNMLTDVHSVKVDTRYGDTSSPFVIGWLGDLQVAFMARHGAVHSIPPSEINYRANIEGFKHLGVTELISLSAVGSLREDLPPGTMVLVDQYVDRTVNRQSTFFDGGCVAHVSMAHPVCSRLGKHVSQAAQGASIPLVEGGTYLVMEGPQFSTVAESEMYRSWGCDVIGMTNMPEAKLAREAEICYSAIAMVTDYDCWHPKHDDVSVDQIVETVRGNSAKAQALVASALEALREAGDVQCSCHNALDGAIMTDLSALSAETIARLEPIAGRVLRPIEMQ